MMLSILAILAPLLAVALAGVLFKLSNALTHRLESILLTVLINILLPCLIFIFVTGNTALDNAVNVLSAPIAGFLSITLGYIICYTAARLARLDADKIRSFVFTTAVFNYGFLAIPICDHLFGSEAVGVLLVFNMGIDMAFWSVGIFILTGFTLSGLKKFAKNPPLIAVIGSVIINFAGWDAHIPSQIKTALTLPASFAIPLGIFISGAALSTGLKSLSFKFDIKVPALSVFLRLGFIPLIMLFAAKYLPVPELMKKVIAVQSAMPSGMLSVAIVKYYGRDVFTSVQSILTTTIVSLVTIPLWIAFALKFLDL